jgi:hypothetical protein
MTQDTASPEVVRQESVPAGVPQAGGARRLESGGELVSRDTAGY